MQNQVKNGNNWLEAQGDAAGRMEIVGGAAAGQSGAAVNPVLTGRLDASGNLQADGCTQNVTLLPSAARTAGFQSADQVNQNFRGIQIYLNVTAASGTGGLTLALQGKDPISGEYRQVAVAAAAVTAVTSSPKLYCLYPGSTTSADAFTVSVPALPAIWRISIGVGDASSYTYSVSADLIP